jgi:hypothetical protein
VYSGRMSHNEASGTTFPTVSTLLCKAIMCQLWPMANLGRGSHIPWARQARENKVILLLWVSELRWTFLPSTTPEEIRTSLRDSTDIVFTGIIPRAAAHLFESLQGAPLNHTRQNSGLKTPTRYSAASMTGLLQNGAFQNHSKAGNDKAWQMTATYVEVGHMSSSWNF